MKNRRGAASGSVAELALDHIRLDTTQAQIDKLASLGEYYVSYYRLLNIMGLRKMDARSVEELKEELQLASVRAKAVIERDQNLYSANVLAAKKRQVRQKEAEDERKRQAEHDEQVRKINAEIDARIKAEVSPTPVKK